MKRFGRWEFWAALSFVIAAFVVGCKWLLMAAAIGDSRFLPAPACNAACRLGWSQYEAVAAYWLEGGLVLLAISVLLIAWGARPRFGRKMR